MLTFFAEVFLFLVFVLFCLYFPGRFFLSRLKLTLSPHELLFFPIGFGLGIFLLLVYLLSWIKLSVLALPILLVIDFLYLRKNKRLQFTLEKKHREPIVIVLLLGLIFSLSMVFTGVWGDGINYRHDDPWHLALINELKVNFPPDNPGIAGIPLYGYHFFYNLLLAQVSNTFFISPIGLHFHLIPLFIAFLWGTGVYSLLFRWSKSIAVSLWGVFLTMFGGSFAFMLSFQGYVVNFDSGLGMAQPADSLYNPPLSLSMVFILVVLFALYEYFTTREKKWLVPIILMTGMVAMVKVYAAIILAGGLSFAAGIDVLKKRFSLLLSLGGIGILFLGTLGVFVLGHGGLFLNPLWPTHQLLQSFEWFNYDQRMEILRQTNSFGAILKIELYGLFLFVIGNLGTRIIGVLLLLFFFFKKPRKWPSLFGSTVFVMLSIALIIPLLFIQSGKVFEIIQMTEYYVFFVSLFAAIGFGTFFHQRFNKLLKAVLFLFIILLTLPSASVMVREATGFIGEEKSLSDPYYQTTRDLLQVPNYNATVLEMPDKLTEPTEVSVTWWYNASTPSIGAFGNKRMYLNNQFISFPGVDINPRIAFLKELVLFTRVRETNTPENILQKLKQNNIRYIYSTYDVKFFNDLKGLKKISSQTPYVVYEVKR